MQKRTPKVDSIRRTSSAGTRLPARDGRPEGRQVARRDVGVLQEAICIVGTRASPCRPRVRYVARARTRIETPNRHVRARACSVPSAPSRSPRCGTSAWGSRNTSPARSLPPPRTARRCRSTSRGEAAPPFGKAGRSDVYWNLRGVVGPDLRPAVRRRSIRETRPTPRTHDVRAAARVHRAPLRATRASGAAPLAHEHHAGARLAREYASSCRWYRG